MDFFFFFKGQYTDNNHSLHKLQVIVSRHSAGGVLPIVKTFVYDCWYWAK